MYKALNLDTGKFLAVKEICPYEGQQKPSLNVGQLCQEIEVYQKLEHENIVRYLGAKQEEEDTYIYMEYMPGGSISSMLKQYGSFEEKVIKKFTKHVALGLHYLHTKGVIHRDIKVYSGFILILISEKGRKYIIRWRWECEIGRFWSSKACRLFTICGKCIRI